ncbi:MAG: hypothetical protein H0X24_21010 [Ktedonobacterales bacterium]|nr:hypothetical protein [Ktedonobacterales bacterium]
MQPTIPYDRYTQEMTQVLAFIAAKTGLPLYDLEKEYHTGTPASHLA